MYRMFIENAKKKLDKGDSFIYNLCKEIMVFVIEANSYRYKLSLIALKIF